MEFMYKLKINEILLEVKYVGFQSDHNEQPHEEVNYFYAF